jgi:hypothetical protein
MVLNHNQIYNLLYINSTSEYKGILIESEERLLLLQLTRCFDKVTSPYKGYCICTTQDQLTDILSNNLEADIFRLT